MAGKDTFTVERSTTIDAPAAAVFARLVDFHRWGEWSPWEDIDPAMSRTFSGAESGVGAVYEWSGNKKAGAGRMEVLAVEAPGHARRELTVTMAEGEKKRVALDAGAVTDEEAATPGVAVSSAGSGKKTFGYVLGGLGIAGVGVGAVTGIMTLGKKSTVDDNCDAQKRCNAEGADAADAGRTLGTISGVSFIVGSVALATGAYLVLSSDEKERPTTALIPGAGSVSVLHRF